MKTIYRVWSEDCNSYWSYNYYTSRESAQKDIEKIYVGNLDWAKRYTDIEEVTLHD